MPPAYAKSAEYRALFAGVLEAPEDDAPRLVLADWLEEHGAAERAEFIRVQIELARLPRRDPRRRELLAREKALVEALGREWQVPPKAFRNAHFDPSFRRGFQDSVTCAHWEAFQTQADGLFSVAPLRKLYVVSLPPRNLKALSRSPWLARLRELRLFVQFTVDDLGELVNSPHAASLTGLEIFGRGVQKLGPGAARVLAESPQLTGLTVLELSDLDLGDEGVRALADSSLLANLDRLSLGACRIGPETVKALASGQVGRLTELNLSWNTIGPEGVAALVGMEALADLETLFLRGCGVGPGGARALAEARHLRNLAHLWLDRNGIGPEGAADLAASSHLATLEGLNLAKNGIGDEGARALASSPYLANLVFLNLHENALGPAGVAALADSPHFGKLWNFQLGHADVDEAGKAILRQRFKSRVSFCYP